MEYLVFAPCSRRKRAAVAPALTARSLPLAPMRELALAWVDRMHAAPASIRAVDLYAGRGLVEARRAAAGGGHLALVSAGLGIVDAGRSVAPYSLTIAAGDPDCILDRHAEDTRPSPAAWWAALQRALGASRGSFARALAATDGVAILALPGTYLQMVAEELSELPESTRARLRLIGPPREAVPDGLRGFWMPYDARFDGEGCPIPGTRGDFAQRAARHFAESILKTAPDGDATRHSALVEAALCPLRATTAPQRQGGTDAELIDVIRTLLPRTGGRSGETLRQLRRHAGWACEQGRFRRLFAAATRGGLVQ